MGCLHPLDVLFQTEHGTVFRCRECRWYNVLFGPVILTHSRRGVPASSTRENLGVYLASSYPHGVSPARLSRNLFGRAVRSVAVRLAE